MKRIAHGRPFGAWIVILFFTLSLFAGAETSAPEYELVRIIDGDTIVVKGQGRDNIKVRLLGVDCIEVRRTKRLSKQAREFGLDDDEALERGHQATDFVVEQLKGQSISLEYEEGLNDRYGRDLAYVWLGTDQSDPEKNLLNLHLLTTGHAMFYDNRRPIKYDVLFRSAESAAKTEQIGIWAPPMPRATPVPPAQESASNRQSGSNHQSASTQQSASGDGRALPWREIAIVLFILLIGKKRRFRSSK